MFGGKLKSYDEAKIAGMPGVRRSCKVKDTAVAVVADTWWHAKSALDALPIVWDEGADATQSSATIAEHLKEGLTAADHQRRLGERRRAKARSQAPPRRSRRSTDAVPRPRHHGADELHRAGSRPTRPRSGCRRRTPKASLAALSEASGVPLAKCEVYRHDLGGGFGRRGGTQDYVHQAVAIAKQFPGIPVKLIWSREEDMAHDFYRPISQCKVSRRPRRRRQPRRPAHARVRASRSTPSRIRRRSSAARTCASCRACTRSRATRSSATRCRTC